MARLIRVILPPHDAVAARLIDPRRSADRHEPYVHRELPDRDIRIHTIEYDAARFVLIESKMNQAAQEIPRLRVPLADGMRDLPREQIILSRVAEKRNQIARGRVADPEDEWVLGRVYQLVQVGRIESALEADLVWIGRAGEGSLGAIGERPVVASDRNDLAVFRQAPRQRGFGSIEA